MRLQIVSSKNAASLYVVKSIYENGKRSSKVVEKLGTVADLEKKLIDQDPIEWAKNYVEELNKKEKEEKREVLVKYSPSKLIDKGEPRLFNGGYLFLQKIYHDLGLHKICMEISQKYKFDFDLDSILSRLIYGRIIFPSSKLATYELSKKFIEQPKYDLHQIYRALEILAKETDFIQSSLYKNSLKVSKRNTGVLYYDCTNYFFEIEQGDGIKQYGPSKEHRPNPIVQMGLFMDGDGIPLAFSINRGNMNEQLTLKPLEKKIVSDFELSKFIVCTDAGLASEANRKFNDKDGRAFITTQSIKKLKAHLKKWALDPDGWKLPGSKKNYDISELDEMIDKATPEDKAKISAKVYFKERWIKENGFEQRLIVTYSIKYRDYQRKIRNSQIERAQKTIDTNPTKIKKCNANDYKRFIHKTSYTPDGEIAKKEIYSIDQAIIQKEEAFDGFYGVCTNLEDDVPEIIKVNHRRWEIEECFRIMKSEFKARPVFLKKDDRIEAHFSTCFISLVIYRMLEKRLKEEFTCHEIISELRDMNFKEIKGEGYEPLYTRTDFTDALHEAFDFRTDYQIVTKSKMKKILKDTKK
ncbi:IS1634 family transposase [Alkalicella caledoniensis]|uniref:IS1634 family transposase n=1 Tax=Alkalicella caledoniensis TaxID=2731377 RepID=A0A7G9WCR8_ALKCA|nr:IS1634 family transposase [Alkalicella caledoniensis]QNO13563.1 IS1634 family transposase [Alkalicella caledoniensis]QNO13968.1 IS1634 family transposase [Alkalicella caledoniensis]QNO15047.1 IS1634 family transposase [Alkalicella caledoniensis]QNO15439.1 IS1634 family transposase [Alkalicella caledoniensis]QNO15751.1 IS1634 family transposase [Alkalicella caledoniensis]